MLLKVNYRFNYHLKHSCGRESEFSLSRHLSNMPYVGFHHDHDSSMSTSYKQIGASGCEGQGIRFKCSGFHHPIQLQEQDLSFI